jgi:hypothetical protein
MHHVYDQYNFAIVLTLAGRGGWELTARTGDVRGVNGP